MTVLFIKTLNRCLFSDKCNNNIAVLRRRALLNNNNIPVKYVSINH